MLGLRYIFIIILHCKLYKLTIFFNCWTEIKKFPLYFFQRAGKNGIFNFFSVELDVSVMDSDGSGDEKKHRPAYRIFSHIGLMDKVGKMYHS